MHECEDNRFASPRIVAGRVVFTFHSHEAKSITLSGDFNGWNGTPYKREANGFWTAAVAVPAAGRYGYKFVVDGRWQEDPTNVVKIEDGFGGLNSVLHVA
jgi:1,4-alpha-glucan branching enzyme